MPTNFSHTQRIRSEYQPTERGRSVVRRILAVGFALPLLLAGQAQAARLIVTIQGARDADGYFYVALFSRPDGFPDGNFSDRHMKLKASTEPVSVVFDDLAPGIYAVGTYHDENNNGRLDTNFIGYPMEGYALSNGIRAVFSRPRFIDAAFPVGGEDAHVTLHIEY
jgi:uncharacterized protein (DUF2141 family)